MVESKHLDDLIITLFIRSNKEAVIQTLDLRLLSLDSLNACNKSTLKERVAGKVSRGLESKRVAGDFDDSRRRLSTLFLV